MKQDALKIAVGVLVGILIAIVGRQWLAGSAGANEEERVASEPPIDLDLLAEKVASRIESPSGGEFLPIPGHLRLEPADEDSEPVRVPVPTASVEGATGDTDARLLAIEERLMTLEEAIRAGEWLDPPPDPYLLRNARQTRDWELLEELARTWWKDPQAAADSVLYLDYGEVLARYGRPTSITRKNEWYYRLPRENGLVVPYIELRFVNGHVTHMCVRRMQ